MTMLAGCQTSSKTQRLEGLSNPDVLVRLSAIKWAGQNKVAEAVEPLVDCLDDDDASVRFFAIQALVKITGQDHGYDYKADAQSRCAAMEQWQRAAAEKKEEQDL